MKKYLLLSGLVINLFCSQVHGAADAKTAAMHVDDGAALPPTAPLLSSDASALASEFSNFLIHIGNNDDKKAAGFIEAADQRYTDQAFNSLPKQMRHNLKCPSLTALDSALNHVNEKEADWKKREAIIRSLREKNPQTFYNCYTTDGYTHESASRHYKVPIPTPTCDTCCNCILWCIYVTACCPTEFGDVNVIDFAAYKNHVRLLRLLLDTLPADRKHLLNDAMGYAQRGNAAQALAFLREKQRFLNDGQPLNGAMTGAPNKAPISLGASRS